MPTPTQQLCALLRDGHVLTDVDRHLPTHRSEQRDVSLGDRARASGDAQRFDQVYAQWAKAKDITTERLYLDMMEEVLRNVNKVTEIGSELTELANDRQLPYWQAHGDFMRGWCATRAGRAGDAVGLLQEGQAAAAAVNAGQAADGTKTSSSFSTFGWGNIPACRSAHLQRAMLLPQPRHKMPFCSATRRRLPRA